MIVWFSVGIIFILFFVVYILFKWGNMKVVGVMLVRIFIFIVIFFILGLDVGFIMFLFIEFVGYVDISVSFEYVFINLFVIEFGFWGFLIWGFYFFICFYFCVIELKVKFFEFFVVKFVNNVVIIGICVFMVFLLLFNFLWYLLLVGDGELVVFVFYLIVFVVIVFVVYLSISIKYVCILSFIIMWVFIVLIIGMWVVVFVFGESEIMVYFINLGFIGGYFVNIDNFVLFINEYYEFYLFWWFSWSIMIGQFMFCFVGGFKIY